MSALAEAWRALQLGGFVVYPLMILALVATTIILDRSYVVGVRSRIPPVWRQVLDRPELVWAEIEASWRDMGPEHPFFGFFAVIVSQRQKPTWWLESRASEAAQQVEASLSRGMWVLETVVTAAPLLGLLGTITGMMQSFRLIGGSGLVEPTRVTAGVAEALIATAFGLLIALISLFGYNYFARRQAALLDVMERLGTRLIDQARLDHDDVPVNRQAVGVWHETP